MELATLVLGFLVALVIIFLLNNVLVAAPDRPWYVKQQSYILPREREGESEVHRNARLPNELLRRPPNGAKTLYENFKKTKERLGSKQCLGYRANDGPYQWLTYDEVYTRFTNFGSGLIHLGAKPKDFIGIYSINRVEWVLAEQASNAYSMCAVPLYDTLGPEAVEYIINQAELRVVVCSKDKTPLLLKSLSKCPSVNLIVQMEELDSSQQTQPAPGVQIISFSTVEALGAKNPAPHIPPAPSDLATICYTSGTTGNPKGVMLTHENLMANTAALAINADINQDDVHISYLPLAHMFERAVQAVIFLAGGSIGFFRGDIPKLFDDIATLRPTVFASVPRLFNRLYDKIQANIESAGIVKKLLFRIAYAHKKRLLDTYGIVESPVFDKLVFSKISARLGGRVRAMITGSAPISQEVLTFLRVCFSCPVIEGYGQTECTAGATTTLLEDMSVGHVGGPVASVEVKLVDVPDMNYHATDKPYPRGEICFRGPSVSQGYYKAPAQTAETIDSHGWLHSGDIGMWLPNGTLKIIDRKKNIFKLSQGEYIAPEKIENVFVRSPLVAQAFVYGDSLKHCLVAIIVPDKEQLELWARERNIPTNDFAALCRRNDVRDAIFESMNTVGKQANLRGFEFVKAIHLTPDPFTVENNLLTPTFKLKRPQAKERYQKELAELYANIKE